MELKFRGTTIIYQTSGEGKPLILLHGFLESSNIWIPYIKTLSEYRQIVTIDLPGNGKSGIIKAVHSMELMADVVKAVMDHLEIKKASLVGHSMGGYVSLAFIEKFPEASGEIFLMNSTPEADSAERATNRDRSIELVKTHKIAFINMAISDLMPTEKHSQYQKELKELKEEAYKFPTKGITAALEGMKIRTDKTQVLKSFNNKKFLLIGKKDPIIGWETVKKISISTNSNFILTQDGHLSYLENYSKIHKMMYFID